VLKNSTGRKPLLRTTAHIVCESHPRRSAAG
jgi:hypothetical protein